MAVHFAARQGCDFTDGFVDVDPAVPRWTFLCEGANPADDFTSPLAVCDDKLGGLPSFLQVPSREPVQASRGVVDHCGERLIDFMGDRGTHFSQRCNSCDVGQLRLGAAQRVLGLLTLDELPNLAAYGGHHVEQVPVGLPYLVAEELHDAQDFAAKQDGNAEPGVQRFARSDGRTLEIRIVDDIGNVGGFTAQPDSPWQPYPGHERSLAGGGLKLRDFYGFLMPDLHAAQHTRLPVVAPQRAQVPSEAVAHGREYFGSCFFESRRLREDLCDRVLRDETMLGPLALGDVLHGAKHAPGSTRLVPHRVALAADAPYLTAGPDGAVFHVVPPPALERVRHGRRPHLTVCRVEELLHITEGEDAFPRPQPKDAVGFVRPGVAICREIALPVADVRDALGLF